LFGIFPGYANRDTQQPIQLESAQKAAESIFVDILYMAGGIKLMLHVVIENHFDLLPRIHSTAVLIQKQ